MKNTYISNIKKSLILLEKKRSFLKNFNIYIYKNDEGNKNVQSSKFT